MILKQSVQNGRNLSEDKKNQPEQKCYVTFGTKVGTKKNLHLQKKISRKIEIENVQGNQSRNRRQTRNRLTNS